MVGCLNKMETRTVVVGCFNKMEPRNVMVACLNKMEHRQNDIQRITKRLSKTRERQL